MFSTNGLCDSALQIIFRAVVVAKLMYGSSAWWGFVSATDRQKVKAFIQRCTHAGFILRIMTFKNYVMKLITGCSTRF